MRGLLVPGTDLRAWTEARVALGRVGASLPTGANLEFGADHAAARDAVHARLNVEALARDLRQAGFDTVTVRSRAENRAQYLRRPDLGRRLDAASVEVLACEPRRVARRLTVVVADGLSAAAAQCSAAALLRELHAHLTDWAIDTVVLAEQARVALGDEIGALRGAEAVLVLLGERPGLKSAESLGAYLTYTPRLGMTDALRNCVSNIRAGGLDISTAVTTLIYLLTGARALGRSGVALKDHSALSKLHTSSTTLPDLEQLKGLLHATKDQFDDEGTQNVPAVCGDGLL